MNTHRISQLVFTAIGLAAFPTVGCSQQDQGAAILRPPARDQTATTMEPNGPGPTAPVPTAAKANAAVADWSDIKECDYDLRAQFFAGLERLEARVADQIAELVAKRAAMKGSASTREWDFAMKEMGNSRTYLQAMGVESHQATSETWDQRKEKVGQAWVRTQDAYSKVKASTTS